MNYLKGYLIKCKKCGGTFILCKKGKVTTKQIHCPYCQVIDIYDMKIRINLTQWK